MRPELPHFLTWPGVSPAGYSARPHRLVQRIQISAARPGSKVVRGHERTSPGGRCVRSQGIYVSMEVHMSTRTTGSLSLVLTLSLGCAGSSQDPGSPYVEAVSVPADRGATINVSTQDS